MKDHIAFRPGDRYVISCAAREALVSWVVGREVMVAWPWRTADSQSRFRWDGTVAVPCDPARLDWLQTPWRLEPRVGLNEGDTCLVSIPSIVVAVKSVHRYDPPLDVGWLPRPSLGVEMVATGDTEAAEEAGFVLYFDCDEPIQVAPTDK
jgi:hypothetical protein